MPRRSSGVNAKPCFSVSHFSMSATLFWNFIASGSIPRNASNRMLAGNPVAELRRQRVRNALRADTQADGGPRRQAGGDDDGDQELAAIHGPMLSATWTNLATKTQKHEGARNILVQVTFRVPSCLRDFVA